MVHRSLKIGDYVISPCKNAYNNKYSYWVSKKGYMKAIYAFTPTDQNDLELQLNNAEAYIKVFTLAFEERKEQL